VLFEQILFFFAAFGALAGAVGLITLKNPFFSVLALVAHLLSLAMLFLLLHAEFLAAAQIVVYVGAVMVLYIFVVAYIGGVEESHTGRGALRTIGPLFALAVLVTLSIGIIGSGLTALDSRGAELPAGFGSPAQIGQLLLERFLVPFEAASFLLLVAAVGAVVLAGRKRGLEELDPDTLPERDGQAPMPSDGGGGPSVPFEDKPTRIPGGTQEGPADPTVSRDPDHQTQTREPIS